MLRGRMRSIESHVPGSMITSSAGQRNQSNSSRPNGSKRLSRARPKQTKQLELAIGLEVGAAGAAVELVLEVGQRVLVELLLAQLQHGLDGRHDAMAARLGQQRGVVALRLVGVGAGEIDELRPPHVEQARPRQVLARGDDLVRGLGVGQIAGLVDEDDPAGHGRVPFWSTANMLRSRPIMRSKSGTARIVIAGNETIGDCAARDVHHQNRFAHGSQALGFCAAVVTERLLEAQRVGAVVIIVAVPAEQPIAGLFVARNGALVVARALQAASPGGRGAAPPPRPPPTAAARCRAGRYAARRRSNKAGRACERGRIKDQHIAGELAAALRRRSARPAARRGSGGSFAADRLSVVKTACSSATSAARSLMPAATS